MKCIIKKVMVISISLAFTFLSTSCGLKEEIGEVNLSIKSTPSINEPIKEATKEEIVFNKASLESIEGLVREITKNNRYKGTVGEKETADFLVKFLNNQTYTTQTQSFNVYKEDFKSFLNFFKLNQYNQTEPLATTQNIIGYKKALIDTGKTLVLCAHYDTTEEITGVLDNASGMSVLLEASRILREVPLPFNIEYVFFSSEEYYLTGSRYYISQLDEDKKDNIIGAINIDVIGDALQEEIILGTTDGTTSILSAQLLADIDPIRIKQRMSIGSSDHMSFFKAGIPAVHLSDGELTYELINEKLSLEDLNMDRLVKATDTLVDMIISLSNNVKIAYADEWVVETEDLAPSYQTEKVLDILPSGYHLEEITEQILPHGLSSILTYRLLSKGNEAYVVQYYGQIEDVLSSEKPKEISDYLWLNENGQTSTIITSNGNIITKFSVNSSDAGTIINNLKSKY